MKLVPSKPRIRVELVPAPEQDRAHAVAFFVEWIERAQQAKRVGARKRKSSVE